MDRRNLKKSPIKAFSKPLVSAFYLSLALSLSACVGSVTKDNDTQIKQDKPPEWVLNPPHDSRYIYGVGSAEKMEDLAQATARARQLANADIASQLRVTVSQTNVQSTEVTNATNQSEQVVSSFASNTRLDTESLALEQSETFDTSETSRYVYVLQRLDRSRVVAQLRQEIDEIDTQLESMSIANDSLDLVAQWRSILPALPLLSLRSQSLAMLKLYSQNLVSKPKSDRIMAFEKKLAELIVALAIEVESQTDEGAPFASSVRSALTNKGLTPGEKGVASALKLVIHLNSTTQIQGARSYVFLTVDAALLQAANQNAMLANWNVTERGVSAIASQAKQLAETKAAEQLANDIFDYLTQAGTN